MGRICVPSGIELILNTTVRTGGGCKVTKICLGTPPFRFEEELFVCWGEGAGSCFQNEPVQVLDIEEVRQRPPHTGRDLGQGVADEVVGR
jgi:hypothetical protein